MFLSDENREKLKRIDRYINSLDAETIDASIEAKKIMAKLQDKPMLETYPVSEIIHYVDYLESKINMLEYEMNNQKELTKELTQYLSVMNELTSKGGPIVDTLKSKQGIW